MEIPLLKMIFNIWITLIKILIEILILKLVFLELGGALLKMGEGLIGSLIKFKGGGLLNCVLMRKSSGIDIITLLKVRLLEGILIGKCLFLILNR